MIKSDFALLDVKLGRRALADEFKKQPRLRIPVTITGFITGVSSRDDGESIEFTVDVENVAA